MSDVPSQLKYTPTHEWVLCKDDELTIGVTKHAEQLLGDLVFVELPEIGNNVSDGDELGVVESVKAASDFYTPMGGVVVDVNQKVSENPELVNKDPYGEGWLVKIKPTSLEGLNQLLDAEAYSQKIAEDI